MSAARTKVLAAHRWLGLVLALQLLLSTAGGLFWATRDHKETKGLTRKQAWKPEPLPASGLIPLDAAVKAAGAEGAPLERARLFPRFDAPIWEVRAKDRPVAWIDATTGEVAGPLDEASATAIVATEYTGPGTRLTATLIEKDPPPEWQGKALPVWRVEIEDAYGTRAFVDPGTGETGNNWFTHSEDTWAWFFAMHTMDWDGGALEVNPLLAAFAISVMVLVASGLGLWAFRLGARISARRSS